MFTLHLNSLLTTFRQAIMVVEVGHQQDQEESVGSGKLRGTPTAGQDLTTNHQQGVLHHADSTTMQ